MIKSERDKLMDLVIEEYETGTSDKNIATEFIKFYDSYERLVQALKKIKSMGCDLAEECGACEAHSALKDVGEA